MFRTMSAVARSPVATVSSRVMACSLASRWQSNTLRLQEPGEGAETVRVQQLGRIADGLQRGQIGLGVLRVRRSLRFDPERTQSIALGGHSRLDSGYGGCARVHQDV